MAFNLTSCPLGWSDYTPAYGRFLRGIDQTGSTAVDPSGKRAPGNQQADAFASHNHNIQGVFLAGSLSGPETVTGNTRAAAGVFQSAATGGTETRPKNVAVLYCVKS